MPIIKRQLHSYQTSGYLLQPILQCCTGDVNGIYHAHLKSRIVPRLLTRTRQGPRFYNQADDLVDRPLRSREPRLPLQPQHLRITVSDLTPIIREIAPRCLQEVS